MKEDAGGGGKWWWGREGGGSYSWKEMFVLGSFTRSATGSFQVRSVDISISQQQQDHCAEL